MLMILHYLQVTTLVNDVNLALKKAAETVKETSASADKILKDVVTATQSMTSTSKESLITFEDFIDKEGTTTQKSLTQHFKTLDDHLAAQKTGLTGINSTTEQVGEEVYVLICNTLFYLNTSFFLTLSDITTLGHIVTLIHTIKSISSFTLVR